jgi:hypothetical protein
VVGEMSRRRPAVGSGFERGLAGAVPDFEIGGRIPLAEIARADELAEHPVRRERVVVTVRGGLRSRIRGIGHCPDFSVLKNQAFVFVFSPDGDVHHCSGQVVGGNHLVGEQPPKDRVDRT